MYTDEDLNYAIDKGVFSKSSVHDFRVLLAKSKNSPSVDEENFRLIGGFNDIFIVIACSLLMFSSLWVCKAVNDSFGFFVFTIIAWGLAEYFVLKRKMALPAIVLLASFVGGVFGLCVSLVNSSDEVTFTIAAAIAGIGAFLHWRRFSVPITVAVGTAALVGFCIFTLLSLFPESKTWIWLPIFLCGILTFLFAMFWDSSDTSRITRKSDISFWLHLLSAPLIIHPVFYRLGIFDGNEGLSSMLVVVLLYVLMTTVSIAVDRRAFMVSSLAYVLFALTTIIKNYGGVSYSFPLTGMFMGAMLLLLSAYWHKSRERLVSALPMGITQYVPKIIQE